MYDNEILTDLLNKTLDCLKKIQTRAESITVASDLTKSS